MAGWIADNTSNTQLGRAPAEAGVHLTIGEARFLLALITEGWATKGSMVNSVYCFEEAVQLANKLKQAVLGDPHR